MTTWAGIVRVSHMGDRKADDHDFHAGRDQVSAIERGVPHGGTLHVLPPELDVSGGLPIEKRPSLLAAVEGVERGEYAGIIVAYLSRLGRNTREQLRAWDRVEAAGGRIICVAENIDTATPSGRFMRTVMLANAEREREEHVDRFDNLRRWATDAGIWQTNHTPRGYDRDEETRHLTANTHADEVRAAFRDRAAGSSYATIATHLGMTPTGVRRMLSNRAYLGELRSGPYVNPAAHPALVDVETFEAAQRKTARPPRSKVFDGPALLTGLVRCAGCGHVMSRSSGNTYKCPRFHGGAECPAPAAVFAPKLDDYAERIAVVELDKLHADAAEGGSIDRAKAALTVAESELAAYLDAVSAADVGAAAFKAGASRRKATVDAARDQLHAEMGRHTGADVKSWADLNAHQRNRLLRSLFECVIVEKVGRGRKLPVEQRARVLAFGTPTGLPERTSGIVPLVLPDFDQPGVLGLHVGEDALEGAGGRRKVRAQLA